MLVKKYLFWLILLLPFIGKAQNIYSNTLTTVNYLDSIIIKKHQRKIDTNRISIEPNRVTGLASFYSASLNGTLTSTGERYRNKKYTAASNLFKLNTLVRVTNMQNGFTVLVRINDRMHPNMLRKGRVIDLSGLAAQKIHSKSKGVVKVHVEAIGFSKVNPVNE